MNKIIAIVGLLVGSVVVRAHEHDASVSAYRHQDAAARDQAETKPVYRSRIAEMVNYSPVLLWTAIAAVSLYQLTCSDRNGLWVVGLLYSAMKLDSKVQEAVMREKQCKN